MPAAVSDRLRLVEGSLLAFVQRDGAAALKRFGIQEREADWARLADVETPNTVTRVAYTNPGPDRLLPRLAGQHADLQLSRPVTRFLACRPTLAAWRARQLLGTSEPTDVALRDDLVQRRLAAQAADGSWAAQVTLTARNLRELGELGLGRGDGAVDRTAHWLIGRPESVYNPGMFFLSGALVSSQVAIVGLRAQARKESIPGPRPRFRELRAAERKQVLAGDVMIRTPCGPRIMWPNALVLEALLVAGYEEHPRVQRALGFMLTHDWCECGYQHGLGDWRRTEPLTDDEIAAFERACMGEYRYGDVASVDGLERADMAHPMGFIPRVAGLHSGEVDEYRLRRDTHLQGCEVITTRALARTSDARVRRFASAHLWRFAGRQTGPNGEFAWERYGGGMPHAGLLQVLARHDHPASRVAIVRSLPWIVETQNADGSWGEAKHEDSETLAVIEALCRVRDLLPEQLFA